MTLDRRLSLPFEVPTASEQGRRDYTLALAAEQHHSSNLAGDLFRGE
jgi:hypothetical protein